VYKTEIFNHKAVVCLEKTRSAASYSTPLVSMTNDHKWTPVCLLLWNIHCKCSNTHAWPHTHAQTHTLLQGSEGRAVNVISLW